MTTIIGTCTKLKEAYEREARCWEAMENALGIAYSKLSDDDKKELSELVKKETIAANLATARTGLESLTSTVTDIKDRLVRIESVGVGAAAHRTEAREDRTDQRLSQGQILSVVVALVIAIGVVISVITLVKK